VAKEVLLDAAPMFDKKPRLDGMLREWPALVGLTEQLAGHSKSAAISAEGVVAYDDEKLYVAMHVKDAHHKRSAAFGQDEDHAVLTLSFPTPAGPRRTYRVLLFPGVAGRSEGVVNLSGQGKIAGASIIEAPEEGGMAFEAAIPWSAFAEAKRTRTGLRGSLEYKDGDTGVVLATSKRQGNALPLLTLEAEYSLNQGLVFPKGINPEPDREVIGNVVGDAMNERIAVYDRYLAVTGWNYRKGTEFYYQDLQVGKGSDVKRLALMDVTGEGHDDIVIERRVGLPNEAKQYLVVWHFRASDDGPQLIFQHQVGAVSGESRISNRVEIKRVGSQYQIVVSQGAPKDTKVDPDTWDVPPAGGSTLPMLLPWQAIESRTYGYKSQKFEQLDEKKWKPKLAPPKRGTRLWSGSAPPPAPGAHATASPPGESGTAATPPPPRKPSAEELLDQVYELYRSERSAKKAQPSFDFVTNVAGDETAERIVVHAKDLVVFGKRFKTGTSYEYITLGFEDPKDILQVDARDLTGDGRAELIVHGVLRAKASKRLGGEVITRHALFIYSIKESGIVRVFAAETGRSLGDKRILGGVRFIPNGAGVKLELRPGRAVGWSAESYPFPEDRTQYGGLEPLLLPWTRLPARRYEFADGKFRANE